MTLTHAGHGVHSLTPLDQRLHSKVHSLTPLDQLTSSHLPLTWCSCADQLFEHGRLDSSSYSLLGFATIW